MITLLDVAKAAGVSTASVSRFINNPSSVREKRAKRIMEAIEKLDYKIDSSARSLKTGKYNRIRIISPATGPFYWEIMSAIAYALSPSGYSIDITFTREPKYRRNDRHGLYTRRNVDGTIFFPLVTTEDDEFITYLEKQEEHFVIIDREIAGDNFHQVVIDNHNIGAAAAKLLLSNGHRQFLFIKGSEDLASCHERLEGFIQALAEHNIILEPDRIIEGKYNPELTYNTVKARSSSFPSFTAVFASNDLSALAFTRAMFEEKRLIVPQHYSIVSVDDSDYIPYCLPLLTSFRLPLQSLGSIAAGMILSQIEGSVSTEKKVILKAELINRDSISAVTH